ncbi:class II fructose-bisphosphate aldolase, partial [Proteus terrae]
RNFTVEGELGAIGGSEDGKAVAAEDICFTTVDDPKRFVEETQVDMLAVSVGTVHGLYTGKAQIQHARLKAISEATGVPLVLHGGTGIADEDMRRAIACGTAKINVNTENMYAWCQQVKAIFAADTGHDVNDPRKVITQGLQPVREMIARRMALFGSQQRY